jgi:hypothetical protein
MADDLYDEFTDANVEEHHESLDDVKIESVS